MNVNAQLERLVDLALNATDPAPYQRRIAALEANRKQMVEEIERLEAESAQTRAMREMTERDVQKAV